MSELEQKGYVASLEDIEQITQSALQAGESLSGGKTNYLRALVGTTQQLLGPKRKTSMDEAETRRQLEAIEEVHGRFYVSVMKTVESVPITDEERGKDRRTVYNNRATFARTAKSTLRSWVKSGNNIRSLTPSRVTKYALQAETQVNTPSTRPPSERFLAGLTAKILERVKVAPKEVSVKLIEGMIDRLVAGLMELGVGTTSSLDEALLQGKLLKTPTGAVWAARAEPERKPPRRAVRQEEAVA